MPCSNTKDNLWDGVFLSLIHYCIIAAEFLVNFPMPNPLTSPPMATKLCQDCVTSISQHRNMAGLLVKVEAVGEHPQGQQTSPGCAADHPSVACGDQNLEPHQNLSGCS